MDGNLPPVFQALRAMEQQALVAYWRAGGLLEALRSAFRAAAVERIAVVSGSYSSATASQTAFAEGHGFRPIRLDATRAVDAAAWGQELGAGADRALAALGLGSAANKRRRQPRCCHRWFASSGHTEFPRWRKVRLAISCRATEPYRLGRERTGEGLAASAALFLCGSAKHRGSRRCGLVGTALMPLLRMLGVQKRFGGVHALRGVDFDLTAGEVHVLLGENGAGKSTLMGVLSGAIAPDEGTVVVGGHSVRFASPREAHAAGIAMIPQELDLVPGLDIAANLFLGNERTRTGVLDHRRMRVEAQELLRRAGVSLDASQVIANLRLGERQLVAIAKALAAQARILIMDEPTAALSAVEADNLFTVVRDLRGRGVGIVYISHRLEEVPRIADRVTVMRDGAVVGETAPDAPQGELVRRLVGRSFSELFPQRPARVGAPILHLKDAAFDPVIPRAGWQAPVKVSLTVHAGEIVGLAGLMGVGRTELLSALYGFGVKGRWRGTVEIRGEPVRLGTIQGARRAGISYVTDDRRGTGLVLRHTVAQNVVMSTLKRVTPFGLVSRVLERAEVARALDDYDVRPRSPDARVVNLSGGNQQKVVFAKELMSGPGLLLLDEPTRGVDVGAKAEIYRRLRGLSDSGLGVLVASSELPELIGLCDRIIVMHAGQTVREFGPDASEELVRHCSEHQDWAA